jgi:hypothetical protein
VKGEELTLEGAPETGSTKVHPALPENISLGRDKRTSLFSLVVSDEKSFYNIVICTIDLLYYASSVHLWMFDDYNFV